MAETDPASFRFTPVGVLRTPFRAQPGTPIQPTWGAAAEGRAVLDPPYRAALADLDGFERVWLLYVLDRARPWAPRIVPYRDTTARGLFATRAPSRPNPIGLSVVQVVRVEDGVLVFRGADMLDGSPLLDIKPYVPAFDAWPDARAGWFDAAGESGTAREAADARFAREDGDEPDVG